MHEVVVAAFFFDAKEVTMKAYADCVGKGACKPAAQDNPFCNAKLADRDDHPANCIDWNDADAYCKSVGKRLPTEGEWEYAARGGAERRTFSWGAEDADETRACYKHPGGSCPVGSFPPGAFGLYDVNGNVWEWTSSWFGSYPGELATGQFKVYRGGSWSRRFPKWLRNELRNRYKVNEHSASLGVRCAQTVNPLTCPAQTVKDGERCVRSEGLPQCETGLAWNAKECVVSAETTLASGNAVPQGGAPSGPGAAEPASSASAAAAAPSDEPHAYDDTGDVTYLRTRTPGNDADCQRNWPNTPIAYRWDGGTFHSRNKPIASAGCQKRDMGRTWTSACCKS